MEINIDGFSNLVEELEGINMMGEAFQRQKENIIIGIDIGIGIDDDDIPF